MKVSITLILLATCTAAVKDIGKLNLIKVDLKEVAYKTMMMSENGILSAPPLVHLDTEKLESYPCFENLRSNRWSLGIPIIFWTKRYMEMINKNINTIEFFKKFKTNVSEIILPPSGILAYRLNWRRRYELFDESLVYIDSFWYHSSLDFVLPKYHNFIIEFMSSNSSEEMCQKFKNKLLNETLQSQELTVDFVVRKVKELSLPPVKILIGDIRGTTMFNDTGCNGKSTCFVSYEYAEKWSFEVSTNVMKGFNLIHLSLQKDIYDIVLNNYLCKNKVPISQVETVKKLKLKQNVEMGCKVPQKVYTTMHNVCETQRVYSNNYNSYYDRNRYLEKEVCVDKAVNYDNEIVSKMDQGLVADEKNEFSVPLKRP